VVTLSQKYPVKCAASRSICLRMRTVKPSTIIATSNTFQGLVHRKVAACTANEFVHGV
jgi:hypothetical protein